MHVVLNIYYKGDEKAFMKKEEFNGKSFIILREYSYGGLIEHIKNPSNNITFYETDSHEAAFKMLKSNRADYLLDYHTPAIRTLKSIKIHNLKSVKISSVPLKFVVSKKVPDAQILLEKLEKAYEIFIRRKDMKLK